MKKAMFVLAAVAMFGVGCDERRDDSLLDKNEGVGEELREDVDNAANEVEDEVEDSTDRK